MRGHHKDRDLRGKNGKIGTTGKEVQVDHKVDQRAPELSKVHRAHVDGKAKTKEQERAT